MPSSDSELSCAPPGSFPALQSPQAPPSQRASLRRKADVAHALLDSGVLEDAGALTDPALTA